MSLCLAAVKHACPQCGAAFEAKNSRANRARKIGASLYCGRTCAGLARRLPASKTPEQKKAEKTAYDRQRREGRAEQIKAEKRAYYEANRERLLAQMTEYRKVRMPLHAEYCKRPEYKTYKRQYDYKRREAKYAEWADAWRLLLDLEKEIRSQATVYERRVANGYYTRNAQTRRRELWKLRKNLNLTPETSSRNFGKR